jgi:hypothetical protein
MSSVKDDPMGPFDSVFQDRKPWFGVIFIPEDAMD